MSDKAEKPGAASNFLLHPKKMETLDVNGDKGAEVGFDTDHKGPRKNINVFGQSKPSTDFTEKMTEKTEIERRSRNESPAHVISADEAG